jgi:UDP-N-acetyl-D-mannosaminuronic acid transferase (WecB/TagA/CpsF family)
MLDNVDGAPLQAVLQLRDGSDADLAALYQPMLARETNRRPGMSRPMPADMIDSLCAIADREYARLYLLTDRDEIASWWEYPTRRPPPWCCDSL